MPADHIARAYETSETRGLLKAIVDEDNKKIIGAAMLCAGGGELMSILQMALMGESLMTGSVMPYLPIRPSPSR